MRVWLITVGEPLPIDGGNERLLRAGILAQLLEERGHELVWWTSCFDHVRKKHRSASDEVIEVSTKGRIVLLRGCGYLKNISIRRIIDHRGVAKKFARASKKEPPPDILLCSLPTLTLALAATAYGKAKSVPVLVDIRDLWPDALVESVAPWARVFARLLLAPMYRAAGKACRDATGIIGVTQEFMEWGLSHAKREAREADAVFPMGYVEKKPDESLVACADEFWNQQGIFSGRGDFVCCFFGSMGQQFDLETVVQAALLLEGQHRRIRFVLCGKGEKLEHYRKIAQRAESVVFPGWVGAAEIWTLMRRADVGLAPYRSTSNFRGNLPNKPIEYMSAGLPVVTGVDGVLRRLIERFRCGRCYSNGDPRSLADELCQLYDCPEHVKVASENAYRLYRDRFVAEDVYARMIDHLERLTV